MNLKQILIALVASISLLFGNTLKGQNRLVDGEEVYRFYIKLKKEAMIDVEKGKIHSFSRTRSSDGELIHRLNEFSYRQLAEFCDNERKQLRSGRSVRSAGSGYDKSTFSGLVELETARYMSKDDLLKLAGELEAYDDVEYCELSPLTPPPPPSAKKSDTFTPPATPDFSDKQFYLYGNRGGDVVGIYADYAWSLGITGQGVAIADIEWGWDYQHEDFVGQNLIDGLHTTNEAHNDHGTAVCGQMFAADNGFGVTGAVHGADKFIGFSEITQGRPAAILRALDSLKAGDVLVYEMQTGGKGGEFVPADYSQTVWDLTKQASDAGIIVVAAAGNGGQNLDEPYYKNYMDRGDNGSIIVGAGTKIGRERVGFSTYGSRLNLCGIGDWSIYTTGYGSLYGSGNTSYTHNFSGTSSSTPIVASAAVAVQSYAKNRLGKTLTPVEMRELLVSTGTPQGAGGHIGPLPNVKAAILKLDSSFAETYTLTVTNGSNSGKYIKDAAVNVVAEDSAGYIFETWTGDIQTLSSVSSESTTVTMPGADVKITATYRMVPTFTLTVINGSGSGEYGEAEVVSVTAEDSAGYLFEAWTGDVQTISSVSDQSIEVTMPGADVNLTATYRAFNHKLLEQTEFVLESSSSEWGTAYGNEQLLDGSDETFWHSGNGSSLPAEVVFGLQGAYTLTAFAYLPRQDKKKGSVKDYSFSVSADGSSWSEVVNGQFADSKNEAFAEFNETSPISFVKLVMTSTYAELDKVSIADFNLYYGRSDETSISSIKEKAKPTVAMNQNLVRLTGFSDDNAFVSVFGLNGRLLLKERVSFTAGSAQLDLSSLSRGIMIMSVKGKSTDMRKKLLY